jgi:PBP1b-binding outer membrane lipoprotein LpoB
MTMTKLVFAAALSALIATGCGRISYPVPAAQAEAAAAASYYEPGSTRMDPAARDGAVFEYH